MRVAVIGNMNSNSFCITRQLRSRGYDADLLLFNCEIAHFGPDADTFDDSWRAYTKQLSWGDLESFMTVPAKRIADDLKPYDRLIGCGSAPAFADRGGRRLNLFLPYGSDLYELPFFKFKRYDDRSFWRLTNLLAQWGCFRFCRAQQRGIRASGGVGYRWGSDQALALDAVIARISHAARKVTMDIPAIFLPMVDEALRVSPTSGDLAEHLRLAEQFRAKHDVVVLHSCRHIWKTFVDVFSEKANDVLLRGLAEYLKRPDAKRIGIMTFAYGVDVSASRVLCEQLGITDHVLWLPLAKRKTLFALHRHADIVAAEFKNSWVTGGVLFEGMACAKPIMQFRDDDIHRSCFPELYPIMNIRCPEDVAAMFADYVSSPEKWAENGRRGRDWLQRHILDESMAAIENAVRGSQGDPRP